MHFQLLAEKSLISIKKLYNHKPFINNEISKAIMTKSRLRNRFLKKTEVKQIENYFINRETSTNHFCENLKRIISKT